MKLLLFGFMNFPGVCLSAQTELMTPALLERAPRAGGCHGPKGTGGAMGDAGYDAPVSFAQTVPRSLRQDLEEADETEIPLETGHM